ncbi:uncharacterized protein LOC125714600 isoform X2 [Brienomyrus brachyistius]|uniref:uncharacterized protein LOC125714600 isoform X2 n=1 Tax=Brienomyrus brachyistius TaxID=42636 RepID=UPI0020B3571C|nr:uncharacterized protein LOC125714600 isoform X2 [Brienomyrus brachyistius]
MENLNELLPGDRNSDIRINIMGLIDMFLQEQTGQSTDSSRDSMNLAPEVPQSRVHRSDMDIFQWPMATQDVKWPNISGPVEATGFPSSGRNSQFLPSPKKFRHYPSGTLLPSTKLPTIKIHVSVAGETFRTHDNFMKMLKLQMELCSAESSSVILVFCPVVSRVVTDMDAAMARVTEDKPVILVFMHHCHHPSHMTDIAVQPSRSNIVQVVHCAYHETKGLLRCQENDQAAAIVRSELNKYQ